MTVACQTAPPGFTPKTPGLTEHGPQLCPEPEARDALGAFALADLGPAWEAQKSSEDFSHGEPVAVVDLDGDGHLDILLGDRTRLQVYLGQADGTYTEAAEALGFVQTDRASTLSPVDLDGDGTLDLLLGRGDAANQMWMHVDGLWVEEAEERALNLEPHKPKSMAWGDSDGDGDLDLFIANDLRGQAPPEVGDLNEWLRQDGNIFTDISADLSPEERHGYSKIATWMDMDNDGDLDMFIGNHMQPFGPNFALENDGGELSSWPHADLNATMSTMGIDTADLNGDGLMDILLADVLGMPLYISEPDGRWHREDVARGLTLDADAGQFTAWSSMLGDINNDGRVDAIAMMTPAAAGEADPSGELEGLSHSTEQPDALWLQDAHGNFSQVGPAWEMDHTEQAGVGGFVDLNRDGWLDVIKSRRRARTDVWMARCGEAAWLGVRLIGTGGQGHGLGSRVEVEAQGRVQTRWVHSAGRGLQIAVPFETHFGLGQTETIDRLTVRWMDGTEQTWTDIATRQYLTVQSP